MWLLQACKQLNEFMWLILLHQVCLQSMPCWLIKMYWASCKQSNSYTISQLYIQVSYCLKLTRLWLNLPIVGHGHVICMYVLVVYLSFIQNISFTRACSMLCIVSLYCINDCFHIKLEWYINFILVVCSFIPLCPWAIIDRAGIMATTQLSSQH